MALPAWLATMVHVPAAIKVTVEPFVPPVEHTDAVALLKLAVRVLLAVALTVNAGCPRILLDRAAKLRVWLACVMVKLCVTCCAAL